MIDFDEINRRAREAQEKALANLHQNQKEMEKRLEELASDLKQTDEAAVVSEPGKPPRVEISGQALSAEDLEGLAAGQAQLQQMVDQKVAEAAAGNLNFMMEQLLGEDMGVLMAAMETLSAEDGEDWEEEEPFDEAKEQALYTLLEETMARLDALPEPEPVAYGKDATRWERFGILLSGLVSRLNDHALDELDVEEHVPVMEQKIASLVRGSWGISGRGELLEMLRYLSQEGYTLRYQLYAEADSPEDLLEGGEDEEEQANIARAWRFARRYRARYSPAFMTGWDTGRAAILTRWGAYLGWLTENEAVGILWELSQKAAAELTGWREFAASYLFGGLMWKMLCGDSAAASYLGVLADAAIDLLAGGGDRPGGQWRACPWPARRPIGFSQH